MAVTTTGHTFVSAEQVTAANLNAAINSATFATGAVDNSTTQLSGGAIIVKDGGITSGKLASSISITDLTATSAVTTSILTSELEVQTPETGYGASGSIALVLNSDSNIKLVLTGTTTLTTIGMYSGIKNTIAIHNNSGGTLTINWPAWAEAGGSFPATMSTGQKMVVSTYCFGTLTSDIFAVSSI